MKIKLGKEIKEIDKKLERVVDIFKELNLNPEEYIVIRNGEVLTEDEKLEENDKIELIRVISGGN
jgi:sulfur carrier protein ThiS